MNESPFNYNPQRVYNYDPISRQIAPPFSKFLGLVTLASAPTIDTNIDTEPDDGTFGDLTALTNGLVLRIRRNGDDRFNLFNFQDNSDFRLAAYDVTYNARSGPQGTFGMNIRLTFGGQDKFARPIILDSSTNDKIELIIQDDLTGLVQMYALVEGYERR